MSPRPLGWEEVVQALQRLVLLEPETGRDLTEVTERVLLEQIVARFPGSIRKGSALLAVSAPTYRRRLAALEQGKPAAVAD
jgi:hypothetical protein